MKGCTKNVKTKVDTSKRVNEPRMKPSSAKYLPFFVLGRDPSTYLHTIRDTYTCPRHTQIYICVGEWAHATPMRRVGRSLLGEIAFRGRAGHSCLSGAFKMTMIRDTGWGASASSSASFAPRSLTLSRSVSPPRRPIQRRPVPGRADF